MDDTTTCLPKKSSKQKDWIGRQKEQLRLFTWIASTQFNIQLAQFSSKNNNNSKTHDFFSASNISNALCVMCLYLIIYFVLLLMREHNEWQNFITTLHIHDV